MDIIFRINQPLNISKILDTLFFIILTLGGVSSAFIFIIFANNTKTTNTTNTEVTNQTSELKTLHSQLDKWQIPEEARIVPISQNNVYDKESTLDFVEYVDLDTGVMYLYIEKFRTSYAIEFQVLLNADGTPCVYENLEELKQKYNWTD